MLSLRLPSGKVPAASVFTAAIMLRYDKACPIMAQMQGYQIKHLLAKLVTKLMLRSDRFYLLAQSSFFFILQSDVPCHFCLASHVI